MLKLSKEKRRNLKNSTILHLRWKNFYPLINRSQLRNQDKILTKYFKNKRINMFSVILMMTINLMKMKIDNNLLQQILSVWKLSKLLLILKSKEDNFGKIPLSKAENSTVLKVMKNLQIKERLIKHSLIPWT